MKKNRLVIAALIAAVTVSNAFSVNVYAKKYYPGTTNQTSSTGKIGTGTFPSLAEGEAMTVDQAVQRAIERSSTIKSYEDSIEVTEESIDDVKVAFTYATEYETSSAYAISLRSLEAQLATYKDKVEVEKQSIRYQVENYFAGILLAQDYLSIGDWSLDVAKRELDVYKKQYELGMISQNAYDQKVDAYNEVVTKQTTLQNTVSTLYTGLNTLLDYNVAAVYDITLEDLITYEPIDKTTLDAHVALATSSSNANIKALERSVEIAKYTLSLYSALYSNESELQKQANVVQTTSALNDAKLGYEASVKTLYQNILEKEDSYKDLTNQLTTLKNSMSIYEKQYELGQITELQLDSYKLQEKSLAMDIQSAINDHYFYMQQYDNPNLL